MTFGERLKELRNKQCWTQEVVGDKLEVDRVTVTHYESDYRQPDFDKLIKMSSIFNVSIDYLLMGNNPPTHEISGTPYSRMLKQGISNTNKSLSEICAEINKYDFKITKSRLSKLQNGSESPASDEMNSVVSEILGLDQLEFRTLAWLEKIPTDVLEKIKEDKPNE